MKKRKENGEGRLDDAARAGWLYYVAGNTQDEIAAKLGISRQSAQRLVSLAVSEGLVKVRLDHPLASCLELAQRLRQRFDLALCEVVPSDPASDSTTLGIADAAAVEIERQLKSPEMKVMAIGTGRTLKAAGELLPHIDAPDKKIVSLTGNFAPDGSAAFYSVIFTMADVVNARHYPLPMPVVAASPEERDLLHQQIIVHTTLELAAQADVTFLGIGELSPKAPLQEDGFITKAELAALRKAGAVVEILGWAFDAKGRMIDGLTNARVASAPLPSPERSLVIAVAMGDAKLPGIRVALEHRLVNGLITDERTAAKLAAAR
ncbi:MAG: sugar-binding transcriptional regulator [Kiloniellaceae bacterium]